MVGDEMAGAQLCATPQRQESGRNIDFTTSTDPHDIELCSSAFEAVWTIGIPHREYKPN